MKDYRKDIARDSEAFYSPIKIGDEIPSLRKVAILDRYELPEIFAGIKVAAEEEKAEKEAESLGVNLIHTSKLFPGPYLLQFVSEMITNWLSNPTGWIHGGKLFAKFIGQVKFNETVICKGRVKDEEEKGNKRFLICDVWAENISGDKVIVGEVHLSL